MHLASEGSSGVAGAQSRGGGYLKIVIHHKSTKYCEEFKSFH